MDIDPPPSLNGAATAQQNPASTDEIEQNFLTQFASICTDDKDNLVDQFQYVLNSEPSVATAKFFLDMNNWNLQAAVGCYIDYVSSVRNPSMKVLKSCTVGEGEAVTPNTPFTVSWLVQNNGETEWPVGICLREAAGLEQIAVSVPPLRYLETFIVNVPLVSPTQLGEYNTKWRLCTSENMFFGEIINCSVEVSESGTLALTQQLNQLHTSSTASVPVIQSPFPAIGPAPADDEMWDADL